MRGTWHRPESPVVPSFVGLFPDNILTNVAHHPRSSELWDRLVEPRTKSLVCSRCGLAFRSHWTCSDEGCHAGLCIVCVSQAKLPGELAPDLPDADEYECSASSSCHDFLAPAPGRTFLGSFVLGTPRDRSFILVPFASVTHLGFEASLSIDGSATYAAPHNALAVGYGCYPFAVRFSSVAVTSSDLALVSQHLPAVRCEQLLIDLRCHHVYSGYDFGGRVYNAQAVYKALIAPAVRSFYASCAHFGRPPPLPRSVLVLLNVCEASSQTWQELMTRAVADGIRFELLTFRLPLLVASVVGYQPGLVTDWSNRLRASWSVARLVSHHFSNSLRETLEPVLLSSPIGAGPVVVTDFPVASCPDDLAPSPPFLPAGAPGTPGSPMDCDSNASLCDAPSPPSSMLMRFPAVLFPACFTSPSFPSPFVLPPPAASSLALPSSPASLAVCALNTLASLPSSSSSPHAAFPRSPVAPLRPPSAVSGLSRARSLALKAHIGALPLDVAVALSEQPHDAFAAALDDLVPVLLGPRFPALRLSSLPPLASSTRRDAVNLLRGFLLERVAALLPPCPPLLAPV